MHAPVSKLPSTFQATHIANNALIFLIDKTNSTYNMPTNLVCINMESFVILIVFMGDFFGLDLR